MTIQITSSAFAQGQVIPKKYTGEGADVSPPLAWSGVPEKTKELALICDDPDAPAEHVGPLGDLQDSRHGEGLAGGRRAETAATRAGRRTARQNSWPATTTSATAARCPRPATAFIITISSSTRSATRSWPSRAWIRRPF